MVGTMPIEVRLRAIGNVILHVPVMQDYAGRPPLFVVIKQWISFGIYIMHQFNETPCSTHTVEIFTMHGRGGL